MCKTWCKLPCCGPSGRHIGLLVLRVALGIIFVSTGATKLQNLDATAGFFDSVGIPLANLAAPLVGALELVGGLMLIAGYQAILAAHWLVAIILVAILTTKIGQPIKMWHLDLAVLGGLFGVIASGSGAWTLFGKKHCCHDSCDDKEKKDCCGGACMGADGKGPCNGACKSC